MLRRELYNTKAKPFLKWAGGKRQLLAVIDKIISTKFRNKSFTYIEPFVGSGALLFFLLQKYNIKKAVINDINSDLINTYLTIKNSVEHLIAILKKLEYKYHSLENHPEQKRYFYYSKRELFNKKISDNITQAALFIFLNRTCYNGLYRVNKKNEFNVPMGKYKKPIICDEDNLRAVSRLLQRVTILNGDFEQTLEYAEKTTLFYFDPPYRPLSKTSSFTAYHKKSFNDNGQIRLAKFCEALDEKGCKWILNNSDVKIANNNDFFDKLYKKFNII